MLINHYFLGLVVANRLNPRIARRDVFRSLSVLKNHISRDCSDKFNLQIMAGGPESFRRLGTRWAISMSYIVRFFAPI